MEDSAKEIRYVVPSRVHREARRRAFVEEITLADLSRRALLVYLANCKGNTGSDLVPPAHSPERNGKAK